MKRVLYISNIEVPYRNEFFNQLALQCDLTVLYERRKSDNRDEKWAKSICKSYKSFYLDGLKVGNENSFSLSIYSWLRKKWDFIIIGCYNSYVQMAAILYLHVKHIPFYINLDGEPFVSKGIKGSLKKFFLQKATCFFVAGECAMQSLKKTLGPQINGVTYNFSSLTESEIKNNSGVKREREAFVLVIGQYIDYKGLDIAYQCACRNKAIRYKFVGMGDRTNLFCKRVGELPENIELIPFLQKEELQKEYKKCQILLLPSRRECWGLVVNEAASFGTPIVSTWGSGAAVEFLSGTEYEKFLAIPGDYESLYSCVKNCVDSDNEEYSNYLRKKSLEYTIERSVNKHIEFINHNATE